MVNIETLKKTQKIKMIQKMLNKKEDKLSSPFSIQIELTEGCNRLCECCGLNGCRNKPGAPFHFMSMELAKILSDQCAHFIPERRYEFAMHGEPTLNPNYIDIIQMFRRKLPKAQMQITTNGAKMRGDKMQKEVDKIFAAGIDFIILDTYYPERDELRKSAYNLKGIEIIDFYNQPKTINIHPWQNSGRWKRHTIILMDDIMVMNGKSPNRIIFNHAGNAKNQPWPKKPLEKKCTNIFREISVCWNGNVNLCCMDFCHEYVCGNVTNNTLKSIWFGREFEAARSFIYNKQRSFTPCARCNYPGGTRQGLMRKTYPPTNSQKALVEDIVLNRNTKTNSHPSQILFNVEKGD